MYKLRRLAHHWKEAPMKKVFLAMLCLAISYTTVLAGEIYGTVKEGGKSIKAGTKIEVKCAKGSYSAETDKLGSYRLFVPEQGKCTLSVKSSDGSPQMTVNSFEDSARYNLALEKKDGKSSLRSE
jgi:hypothetical protein